MPQSITRDTSVIDSESELLHVLIPQLTHFCTLSTGQRRSNLDKTRWIPHRVKIRARPSPAFRFALYTPSLPTGELRSIPTTRRQFSNQDLIICRSEPWKQRLETVWADA